MTTSVSAAVVAGLASIAPLHGTVFEDLDGDGEYDTNEVGISGVDVSLMYMGGSDVTNAYGCYSIPATMETVDTVVEYDKPEYFSTTPNEVVLDIIGGNDYEVNFGDALRSSNFAAICGTVFEDRNGDMIRGQGHEGELGIPGVVINLDGTTTTLTNVLGQYTFNTTGGIHTVSDLRDRPPWIFLHHHQHSAR
jgi:hypothetical protein